MADKGIFIGEMTELGRTYSGLFAASDVQKSLDRNSHPFWSLKLNDRTGSLPAKVWAVNGRLSPEELESGDIVGVTGQPDVYKEERQLRVRSLRVLSEEEKAGLDRNDFLPPTPYDGPRLLAELLDLVARETAGTPWAALVDAWFGDEGRRRAFAEASAARQIHHANRGGLAAHTLGVCRICLAMADLHPGLDRPALVTAALFHDVGKLEEMDTGPFETSYTVEGNVIGHIVSAVAMLDPLCARTGLPKPLRNHLMHMLLSHHGRVEWGAVKEPCTPEAIVLSSADYVDSKLEAMKEHLAKVGEGEMTQRIWEFGGPLWRPVKAPAPSAGPESGAGAPGRVAAADPEASEPAAPETAFPSGAPEAGSALEESRAAPAHAAAESIAMETAASAPEAAVSASSVSEAADPDASAESESEAVLDAAGTRALDAVARSLPGEAAPEAPAGSVPSGRPDASSSPASEGPGRGRKRARRGDAAEGKDGKPRPRQWSLLDLA